MNQVEIEKFRGAVSQDRVVELEVEKEQAERVHRSMSTQAPAQAEYALFVRKMQRTMHFRRVDNAGKLRPCSLRLTRNNKGFTYNEGLQEIELVFEAMRG
jgi:hypothetical protein